MLLNKGKRTLTNTNHAEDVALGDRVDEADLATVAADDP